MIMVYGFSLVTECLYQKKASTLFDNAFSFHVVISSALDDLIA